MESLKLKIWEAPEDLEELRKLGDKTKAKFKTNRCLGVSDKGKQCQKMLSKGIHLCPKCIERISYLSRTCDPIGGMESRRFDESPKNI